MLNFLLGPFTHIPNMSYHSSHPILSHLPSAPASSLFLTPLSSCFGLWSSEFVTEFCVAMVLQLSLGAWRESAVGTEGISLPAVVYPNFRPFTHCVIALFQSRFSLKYMRKGGLGVKVKLFMLRSIYNILIYLINVEYHIICKEILLTTEMYAYIVLPI